MIKVTVKILGTDISSANAKRALRNSEDFAVKLHRKKFMPLHFEPVARLRYKQSYQKQAGKYSRTGKSRAGGQGRRDVNRERRVARSSESPYNAGTKEARKRPIFDSGLTHIKVLRGGAKVTGRFDKRGITYQVPFYIKINPAGQINKIKALNAVNPTEEKFLGRIVETKFAKELNKKKTRKRSK